MEEPVFGERRNASALLNSATKDVEFTLDLVIGSVASQKQKEEAHPRNKCSYATLGEVVTLDKH